MTSPTVYVRKRPSSEPPLIETTDVHEIQGMLMEGMPVTRVPRNLHCLLLGPLSATRAELLLAGRTDDAYNVQNIINTLQIAGVKPGDYPVGTRPATSASVRTNKLPLISGNTIEKKGCEVFWNNEIQRFMDLRAEDLESLEHKYDSKISQLEKAPKPRIVARATSALVSLREKRQCQRHGKLQTRGQNSPDEYNTTSKLMKGLKKGE